MKRDIVIILITIITLAIIYLFTLRGLIYIHTNEFKKAKFFVEYLPSSFPLDPESQLWNKLKIQKVHLFPQSARIPYGTDERDIFVRAAYNDSEVVFILEYEDSTKNVGGFVNPDAAAILFVKKNSPETKQMMGYGAKANIWHWLADRNFQKYKQGKKYINVVRELIAQGPGTQIEMTVQNVKGKGIYKNGKWKIVFKRELKSKYEDEFELGPGIPFEIAFAQWEGQKMESFSKKSISILRTLIWERK